MFILTSTAFDSPLLAAIAIIAMLLAAMTWRRLQLAEVEPVEATEDEIDEDEYDLGGEAAVTITELVDMAMSSLIVNSKGQLVELVKK